MQKCPSPFVEVRQIEFLARETPNYIATNLHTYPINGHASVSGSHLRKRSDEENPQRCYDPSDDRDGTAGGSVNTTCPSTRTNVRFLSSLGRLVLSSMLDAKEQGAQRPEESTIIPFSESRYRSSDVGRGRTYRRAKPIFL